MRRGDLCTTIAEQAANRILASVLPSPGNSDDATGWEVAPSIEECVHSKNWYS